MERINVYYIITAVLVIVFVWLVMVPPIIRMLEYSEVLYRWIVLAMIMPVLTILLLYAALSYVRSVSTEVDKEKMKELVTPELTEKEIFEEAVFDNEKLQVLSVIRTFKKLKGNKILLSAIKKKTGFEIEDIEDMVLILMAEELLDGDLEYSENGPLIIFPEKKEIKVTYKPDADEKNEEIQEK
ncbi:MAG: hypothetical protein ACTSO9_20695 [Candidatus Helarchaeota archaeon]